MFFLLLPQGVESTSVHSGYGEAEQDHTSFVLLTPKGDKERYSPVILMHQTNGSVPAPRGRMRAQVQRSEGVILVEVFLLRESTLLEKHFHFAES